MAIPSSQLNTWSNRGATTTSSNAYNSIQHALTKEGSPLNELGGVDIFLQGSYGNATNIFGDSDVDVVVLYRNTFHKDLSALPVAAQTLHEQTFPDATYHWRDLKRDVLAALRSHYNAGAVTEGHKSIKVQTGYGTRSSDVIPAVQFRKYATFIDRNNLTAHWGMQFFDSANNAIVNYPKYHIERGEDKNQMARTGGQDKSTVRIFKNLRNCLVDQNKLQRGVAPSYFIECALHNVPDLLFRGDYTLTVRAIITHLLNAPFTTLRCQNGVTQLIGTESTQWSIDNFTAFVVAAESLWNNW